MSLDGRAQPVTRVLHNDRPLTNEVACECGGTFYASQNAHYARCTGGEIRCTFCHRPARRFGKSYTCGLGCQSHE